MSHTNIREHGGYPFLAAPSLLHGVVKKVVCVEELKGKHKSEHEMRMLAIGMKKGEVHM